MTTGLIMSTLIYVISMEFLLLRHKRPSWWNAPSHKEWGDRKTAWSQAGDKGAVGSSIISLAIRSSWHPIQRESFLFCLTYSCWKSKYHERYKTTKYETILHKLWWELGGKASNEGSTGRMTGTIKLYEAQLLRFTLLLKQGPSCSKPRFNSMKLSKL